MDRERVLEFFRADRVKLATVSGVLTTSARLVEWLDAAAPAVGMITTKSYELRPNPGYREPVLVEAEPGCYGNAVGLRNPGMGRGLQELRALRRRRTLRALLNVSLSASSAEDFALLAAAFEEEADLLELNFSCPHARGGYGAAIGSRPELVAEYVRAVRAATRAFVLVKLTPNVEDIGAGGPRRRGGGGGRDRGDQHRGPRGLPRAGERRARPVQPQRPPRRPLRGLDPGTGPAEGGRGPRGGRGGGAAAGDGGGGRRDGTCGGCARRARTWWGWARR